MKTLAYIVGLPVIIPFLIIALLWMVFVLPIAALFGATTETYGA
jgi:hypothetical protein